MRVQLVNGILAQPTEHVYQPIWSIDPSNIFGYEALIRFPNGFCNGNIEEAFRLARKQVVLFELDTQSILNAVDRYPKHLWVNNCYLFVNIYPSTVLHANFEIFIENLQRRFPETIGKLVFELNETKLEAELWKKTLFLEKANFLKASGYYIALDDLGEDELDYQKIMWFNPNFIKLDRFFSIKLASSVEKQNKISRYLKYANDQTTIVLEGIEEELDLSAAKKLHVPIVQGFFMGKPENLSEKFGTRGEK